jgi:hypothetical protein
MDGRQVLPQFPRDDETLRVHEVDARHRPATTSPCGPWQSLLRLDPLVLLAPAAFTSTAGVGCCASPKGRRRRPAESTAGGDLRLVRLLGPAIDDHEPSFFHRWCDVAVPGIGRPRGQGRMRAATLSALQAQDREARSIAEDHAHDRAEVSLGRKCPLDGQSPNGGVGRDRGGRS